MIYVCEFDHSADQEFLLNAADAWLGKEIISPIREEEICGVRWEKKRERILAWLLLEYALTCGESWWISAQNSKSSVQNCAIDTGFFRNDSRKQKKSILKELAILRTEYEKPYSSRYPDLFFNISHCESACACILSDHPAGIDIERKFRYKENLKRYICSDNERRWFDQLQDIPDNSEGKSMCSDAGEKEIPSEKEKQLRLLWSMKEAFVKLDGRGLGYGLKNVDLSDLMPIPDSSWQKNGAGLQFFGKLSGQYTLATCEHRLEPSEKKAVQVVSEQSLTEAVRNWSGKISSR